MSKTISRQLYEAYILHAKAKGVSKTRSAHLGQQGGWRKGIIRKSLEGGENFLSLNPKNSPYVNVGFFSDKKLPKAIYGRIFAQSGHSVCK
jgi:hypothetical protein